MTEKELSLYHGKNLRVCCIDNDVIEGFCSLFIQAADNEPEIPAIVIEKENCNSGVEITLPEIKSIEIIN